MNLLHKKNEIVSNYLRRLVMTKKRSARASISTFSALPFTNNNLRGRNSLSGLSHWKQQQQQQQQQNHRFCPSFHVGVPTRRFFANEDDGSRNNNQDNNNGNDKTLEQSLLQSKLSEEWIPPKHRLSSPTSSPLHDGDNTMDQRKGEGGIEEDDNVAEMIVTSQEQERNEKILEEALFVLDEDREYTPEEIDAKLEAALKLEEEMRMEQQEMEKQRESIAMTALEDEEKDRLGNMKQGDDNVSPTVDWLATRRAALGSDKSTVASTSVPVLHRKLLTEDELVQLLEFHQADDIVVIPDNPNVPRMGSPSKNGSIDGGKESVVSMVLCEARGGAFHVQSVTRSLIEHLKARRLQDIGVLGAQMGSNRSKFSTNSSYSGLLSQEEAWNVVDCQNFIVHILDPATRRALNLEALWTGEDPLWQLDISDEDQVDEYVAQHPVPPNYNGGSGSSTDILDNSTSRRSSFSRNGGGGWDISKLERTQFATAQQYHDPVIPGSQKQEDRRLGRQRRREMRQQQRRN